MSTDQANDQGSGTTENPTAGESQDQESPVITETNDSTDSAGGDSPDETDSSDREDTDSADVPSDTDDQDSSDNDPPDEPLSIETLKAMRDSGAVLTEDDIIRLEDAESGDTEEIEQKGSNTDQSGSDTAQSGSEIEQKTVKPKVEDKPRYSKEEYESRMLDNNALLVECRDEQKSLAKEYEKYFPGDDLENFRDRDKSNQSHYSKMLEREMAIRTTRIEAAKGAGLDVDKLGALFNGKSAIDLAMNATGRDRTKTRPKLGQVVDSTAA